MKKRFIYTDYIYKLLYTDWQVELTVARVTLAARCSTPALASSTVSCRGASAALWQAVPASTPKWPSTDRGSCPTPSIKNQNEREEERDCGCLPFVRVAVADNGNFTGVGSLRFRFKSRNTHQPAIKTSSSLLSHYDPTIVFGQGMEGGWKLITKTTSMAVK